MLYAVAFAAAGFVAPSLYATKVHQSQVAMPSVLMGEGGKGFGGGEATRDPEPTVVDPSDPKGKQQAIHKAESFADYLARRGGGAAAAPAPAAAPAAAAPVAGGSPGGISATCKSLEGPAILWGPDGPLQDPMKEESDIKGYDGFGKFADACAAAGIDLDGSEYTVFVPTDATIDEFEINGGVLTADVLKYHIVPGSIKKASWSSADLTTLQGGKLTYRRMFRKDFIDDASPGVEPAGASKGNAYPSDLACDNGLIHACNLVLQPGWTA